MWELVGLLWNKETERHEIGKRVVYRSGNHGEFVEMVSREYDRCELAEFKSGCWELASNKCLPLFAKMIFIEGAQPCIVCGDPVPVIDGWPATSPVWCIDCYNGQQA